MPFQDSEFWVSVKTPVLRIVASVSANHQSIKEDAVVGMLLSLRKISFTPVSRKRKLPVFRLFSHHS